MLAAPGGSGAHVGRDGCLAGVDAGSGRRAYAEPMNRPFLVAIGVVLFLTGCLWTLQGLGVIGGSAMSGNTVWAVIGPVVALLGVLLAVRSSRGLR